ncbi:MqnA/MqnD/SBP family protein [Helicobacter baculiformis]|uniref:Chorismate dehydratase n=1 Tax=Helicobacter baculiformis TaxID=427351 RepID=A0ABV7ZI54_9HELI|nr:MqnA/MqnD/SBP family protein [Helicobacter baculiformis]
MRFGKIAYLNLLPFDVFIKAYPLPLSGFKTFLHLRKTYPAKLNRDFLFRRIDAGFISSIASLRAPHALDCGIVACQEVRSVLVVYQLPSTDKESATSNALAQVLNLRGRVLIGDKALRHYYHAPCPNFDDLATLWWTKTHLPFVFGRFCANKHRDLYERIARAFKNKKIKIPHYVLQKRALESGFSRAQILDYLKYISYNIRPKEHQSLKRFARVLLFKSIKTPKRFF